MKQTIKRMSCLVLVLCLLLTVLPFTTNAEEKTEQVDFVLVLDCSGSMAKNDRTGLAADACKKFMDLLPIENARIAVIAYGYNGKTYNYTHFNVKYDANLVQVLSALDGDMTVEEMAALKKSITSATQKASGSNPSSAIGQALAAGMDILLTGGATDGNACIILLSDGDATSPISYQETLDLAASVPLVAKKHEWPIFCIELDYKGKNETSAGKDNRKRLTDICVNSGAGADARMKVSEPADVTEALLKIFDRFMDVPEGGMSEKLKLDKDGTATREFEVPQLASETNVIISGASLDYVELVTPTATKKITKTGTDGDWIANVEPSSYFAVKILRPEAGPWTVKAYGDPNATIHAYNSSMRELNMVLIGDPASPARVTKNDKISLQAYFTYGGGSLNNSAFYVENEASVIVTSYNNAGDVKTVKEFAMTGDTSGYYFDLPANEIPSGKFDVQVLLKHDMFRSGQKTSNVLTYTSENLPLEHDESQVIDRSGYINSDLDVIDLTTVFPNPDGDPIDYVVECISNRNLSFDVTIDDSDYMYINTGMMVGTHQMQVKATDPDMTEPMVHDFVITVENRALETEKIPEQEIWVDYINNFIIKQDPSNTALDLDLNGYFTDPDGVELVFGEITADVPGLVNAVWSNDNGMMHVEPLAEGDVVLTTTVSDGVETVEAKIEVKVISGKAVYWRDNWIRYALAVLLAIAIVIILVTMFKNTLVKGNWQITLTNENGESCTCEKVDIPVLTNCGKKRKFKLVDLLHELRYYMVGSSEPMNEYVGYFTGGVEKIELCGVLTGKGCSVKNVPGNGSVSVMVNGLEKKSISTSGTLTFLIKDQMDASKWMKIEMNLT